MRTAKCAPRSPEATEPTTPELDVALVRRIYDECWAHAPAAPTEVLASHAGAWVTYADISREMGYDTPRQLPGTLSAFGRRAKHRYGGVSPFDVRKAGDE